MSAKNVKLMFIVLLMFMVGLAFAPFTVGQVGDGWDFGDGWSTDVPEYVIWASADEGVILSPSGAVSVDSGGSVTFTFSPKAGYRISKVIVDDVEVEGYTYSYTFTDVTSNGHTFRVESVSTNVARVADSLMLGVGLFGVLPLAVGVFTFIIAVKSFRDGGGAGVVPAVVSAVIVSVTVEVGAYVVVYFVSAFAG